MNKYEKVYNDIKEKIIKKIYINLLQFIKKYDINRHTVKNKHI